ncbi:IS3 family transposase [Blautia producta]
MCSKSKQCCEESKKRYGAVKIHRKLNEKRITCNIKRVQR